MQLSRRLSAAFATAVVLVGVAAAPAVAAAPTSTVTLVSPANGETVTGNPVLRWTAAAGAVKYRVQVSTSATFATTAYNVDTYALAATPTGDLPLGTLYWRVAATDGSSGIGTYTGAEFVRQAATQPSLVAPADGATLAYPTTPVLRWTPVSGVKNYRVELDDETEFTLPRAYTTANTALALSEPLILDKPYYWRVQGLSATSGVTTQYSETWRFSTNWPASSASPQLQEPIGGAAVDVTDLVFRWSAVPGARTYQIQVNPNPDFANNMTDDLVVDGTQYSPSATYNNATYYWRVRAQDTGSPTPHHGPWSEVAMFKRSWLPQPVLISPTAGTNATSQQFEWSAVPRATYYELQVSTDPNFSPFTFTTCTSYQTRLTATMAETGDRPLSDPPVAGCRPSLDPGTQYHWRVRGIDKPTGVNGVWSDTGVFTYLPASTPTLTAPADGATISAPVLTWNALPGYGQYRVTVLKPGGTVHTTADTYSTSYTPTARLDAGSVYTWYVTGINGDGEVGVAPGSAGRRAFTAAAPAAGGSLDPVATTVTAGYEMPSMAWQPVTGASYYRVFKGIAGSGIFDATPLGGSTKLYQTAYTHDGILAPGSYDWYVQAYDTAGATLGASETDTFTVTSVGFASYVSPANCVLPGCATEHPDTPELVWQPVPGATRYEVHVALDKDFTNEVYTYETAETSLTPRESYLDNTAGQSYFWFVRPCKSQTQCGEFGGSSLQTHAQAFRKKSAPVVLLTPANDAQVGDVASFGWEEYRTSAPDGVGAKQYRLQVASDAAFQTVIDDDTVDQVEYQAYESSYPDGVYYWRVQAVDGEGAPLTWSTARRFTKTSTVPVPAAGDAAATGLPTMTWDAMPYASGYTVEVYRGTSEVFPSASRELTVTTKLPAFAPTGPLPAGWYSWRVRKLDPNGNPGPWSTGTPTFEVRQPAPELLDPAEGAMLATNDLLFTWQAVPGAAAYRFESATSETFATTVERVNTVMTAWAPTTHYADGVTHYWRVRVLDGAGNVMADSATRTLIKDGGQPRVTGVSPTTRAAVDGPITVTFSESVTGVSPGALTLRTAGSTTAIPGTVTATSPTTATYRPTGALMPGQFYELVVGEGITDGFGNPVVQSTTRIQAATAVENTSPALQTRWDVDPAAGASGGAYMSSRQAGSTTTFTFTGTAVTVLGRASVAGGYADVYIDGVKRGTANFYGRTQTFRKAVFTTTGLAAGEHTLVVKVLGTRQSGASGAYVDVDAFVVGGVTYQESASQVRTAFARYTHASASGGSYASAGQEKDSTGPEYRLTFRGTGFTWHATKAPSAGGAAVYIDGRFVATVSQYARTTYYKSLVYTSPRLTDGVHTVRLVATGVVPSGSTGSQVSLDVLTVR